MPPFGKTEAVQIKMSPDLKLRLKRAARIKAKETRQIVAYSTLARDLIEQGVAEIIAREAKVAA